MPPLPHPEHRRWHWSPLPWPTSTTPPQRDRSCRYVSFHLLTIITGPLHTHACIHLCSHSVISPAVVCFLFLSILFITVTQQQWPFIPAGHHNHRPHDDGSNDSQPTPPQPSMPWPNHSRAHEDKHQPVNTAPSRFHGVPPPPSVSTSPASTTHSFRQYHRHPFWYQQPFCCLYHCDHLFQCHQPPPPLDMDDGDSNDNAQRWRWRLPPIQCPGQRYLDYSM